MTSPKRVRASRQRPRPAGTVYVGCAFGKPGKWGNPYPWKQYGRTEAVWLHREWIMAQPEKLAAARRELRGRDLVCWCPPAAECHADTLLEIANEGQP